MGTEALLEIINAGQQIGLDQRLDDYFPSVLRAISKQVRAEYAAVDLVDEAFDGLRCVAEYGARSGDAAEPARLQRDVLTSRKTMAEDRWLAAPVIAGDTVYGIIRLRRESAAGHGFQSDELLAATIVARLVGSEIRNARSLQRGLHFEHLIYRSPDPICVLDRHGRIQHFNRECERIWGMTETEALGMPVDQFYESRETALAIGHAMRNSVDHSIRDYPAAITNRSGQIIPIRLSATLFFDSAGRVAGSVGVFKDDRANLQSQVERLLGEKLAAVGSVSATTAHDVKHDLGAVLSFLDALVQVGSDDALFGEICEGMRAATSNALAKIQNLVMTGRLSPPERQVVSIRSLMTSFVSAIHYQAEVRQTVLAHEPLPHEVFVFVDPDQVRQLLMNLLRNSFDAIYVARVNGHEQWTKPGRIELSVEASKTTVTLTWSDNGCGMSDDVRKNAFTPFFTTKANGSGLGLYLCKLIVERHDGEIAIDPPEYEGCRFRITLPRFEAPS